MSPELESKLEEFDRIEDALLEAAMCLFKAHGGAVYPLDLLANAAIKRAKSLNSAFSMLLRADNFLAAAHLIRLQLDSALRFSAAWIVDDCHKFAHEVLKGVSIRDQKDRTGKKMTDAHLVSVLSEEEPWIARVYEATSGYIHLSEKHIFNTLSLSDEPRTATIEISSKSTPVPNQSKLEAVMAMMAINRVLLGYLAGWHRTKEGSPKKSIRPTRR
ncbi:MAG TPA: hypothetical protein PLU30_23125 [Verrucomicrobiae bacterium]|nr:hypothetical protein [Verrucomicrobiae bacterium]